MMQWTGYGISEKGTVRPTNQDAFCIDNRLKVWAVADGMGGHVGGDIASQLVIDTIVQRLTEYHASLSSVPDGADRVFERVSSFHRDFGPRWTPAPLLERLARAGTTFRSLDRELAAP